MNSKKLISTILVGSFAALSLTACSNKTQQQSVYALDSAYAIAAQEATNYENGTYGTPDPSVVAQIKKYDAIVFKDLVIASDDVQEGTEITTDLVDEIKADTTLIANLVEKAKTAINNSSK